MLLLLHGDPSPATTILGYDFPELHAMVNHFPAALLVVAVFLEIVALVSGRDSFRLVSYWTLILGVIGAGAAVASGLLAEDAIDHGEVIHQIMEEHEMLALWTLGVFTALMLWRIVRERRMTRGERIAALVLGLAGTGLLVDTGRHGGEMVFEHAAGVSNQNMERELKDRLAGHQHEDGATGETHEHVH